MSAPTEGDPWKRLRGLPMGQRIELTAADGRTWRGTIVPAHELSGDRVIQVKLESGYNVGVHVAPDDRLTVFDPPVPASEASGPAPAHPAPARAGVGTAPAVALLLTGGTIASRVDYRTGGVRPVEEESEILSFYPDLDRDGPVRVVPVLDRLSEDIAPEDWQLLARRIASAFEEGARGVVVAHGTDTLAYTAAALSFLLEELPGPVVLVGAQRSPDRPSSDGFTNLTAAVRVARTAAVGEVLVLMHAGLSDDRFAIHRGTRVRKMHTSRRDAFRTLNGRPVGEVVGDTVTFQAEMRAPSGRGVRLDDRLDGGAALLWFQPGLEPARAEAFVKGLRGIVLAGTGLGHVAAVHLPWIRQAISRGLVVIMTSQCLEGAVDPYVYATGRELLRAGVLYAGDMTPETAYVKLLWALARAPDPAGARALFLEDRAGEIATRREYPGAA